MNLAGYCQHVLDCDGLYVNSTPEQETKYTIGKIRCLIVLLPRKWSELQQKARESQALLFNITEVSISKKYGG